MVGISDTSERGEPSAPLTVGVTGHRRLENEARLAALVRDVLADMSERFAATRITVVSALAEGADRLVASEALQRPRSSLEAVLPLEPSDYRDDSNTVESKHQFDRLIAQAARVTVIPPSDSRDEAYERAGRAIVDSCDVLIALWDGGPSKGRGGTAEIIEYAFATLRAAHLDLNRRERSRAGVRPSNTKGHGGISSRARGASTRSSQRRLPAPSSSRVDPRRFVVVQPPAVGNRVQLGDRRLRSCGSSRQPLPEAL